MIDEVHDAGRRRLSVQPKKVVGGVSLSVAGFEDQLRLNLQSAQNTGSIFQKFRV